MESTKNSSVNREVERLLAPLKSKDAGQHKIIQSLIDEVYNDPTLESPESTSREIENRLYKMIDDHIRFDSKND